MTTRWGMISKPHFLKSRTSFWAFADDDFDDGALDPGSLASELFNFPGQASRVFLDLRSTSSASFIGMSASIWPSFALHLGSIR